MFIDIDMNSLHTKRTKHKTYLRHIYQEMLHSYQWHLPKERGHQ